MKFCLVIAALALGLTAQTRIAAGARFAYSEPALFAAHFIDKEKL
jgi:hypothetical protein